MKKFIVILVSLAASVSVAYADLATLAPTQVVVTEDGNGNAQLLVQFDLSGLRSGEGRRIESAILDWALEGVSDEEEANFAAYPLTAAWDDEEIAEELEVPSIGETEAGSWVITPDEHADGLGGVFRMNITATASEWVASPSENHGLVITTSALAAEALAEQANGIRLLVAYGFVGD